MSQYPPITEILKMIIVPAGMVISKQINMKDPEMVKLLRLIWMSMVVAIISIHFLVYSVVSSSKDEKKIWVPPKPKPKVIFVKAPPEEPLKPEEFVVTSYKVVETQLLQDSVQTTAMSIIICAVSSYYFEFHLSLIAQSFLLPITVFDSPVLYRYIRALFLGMNPKARYYNEFHAPPTDAEVKKYFPPIKPREDIKTAPLVLQPHISSSPVSSSTIATSTDDDNETTKLLSGDDSTLKKEDKKLEVIPTTTTTTTEATDED